MERDAAAVIVDFREVLVCLCFLDVFICRCEINMVFDAACRGGHLRETDSTTPTKKVHRQNRRNCALCFIVFAIADYGYVPVW